MPTTTREELIRKRDEFFEVLSKESDRGLVLVSASFLEESLESLLYARFSIKHPKSNSFIKPLFDTFGPLSNFSAKIKICYTIDLIGEWVYQDLEIVRKLRNRFAHSVGFTRFDLPEVVNLTEKLQAADIAATELMKADDKTKKLKKVKTRRKVRSKSAKADMERMRFTMSVSFIGGLLYILTRVLSMDEPWQAKDNFIESIRLAR